MLSSRFFIFLCFLLITFSFVNQLMADDTISGIVFDDLNKNDNMDDGEMGIAKVVVSNQRDVVLTDDSGEFTLPLIEGRSIFVTKPSGFSVPLDENNIPQFSYTYSPHGSPPELKFEGLSAKEQIPDMLYFPLYEDDYLESFKVIFVGDPQQNDSTEVNYYRDDVVENMFDEDARFYMALGDIAGDNLRIFDQYNDVVGQIGIPAYNVPGNHDENYRIEDDAHAMDTFKRIYGPEYYSLNYGKVHFIGLDIVEYLGWNKTENKHGPYRGYLHEDQLTWLNNDLEQVPADHLIVLTMHIPIQTNYSTSDNMNLVNRDKLFEILKSRKHLLALSGHLHVIENLKLNSECGWNSKAPFYSMNLGAGCGAWWSGPKDERSIPLSYCMDGSPNGYFIFSFKGNNFNYKFIPASQSKDYQIRISRPVKPVPVDSLMNTQIVVNVFNADSETEVYLQVDNSNRSLMMRKRMRDPFMVDYFNKNIKEFPWWVNDVEVTDHIWIANLPGNLNSGQHTIEISAIDAFNNIYSQVKIFEVKK